METTYKYKDLKERKEKIAEAEGKGLRMLHDNFDQDWKPGQEPHGTLVFTDAPSPEITSIIELALRDLGKEFDDLKAILKTKGIL